MSSKKCERWKNLVLKEKMSEKIPVEFIERRLDFKKLSLTDK